MHGTARTVLDSFIEIVIESTRKPNKVWVDQGKECYNGHMNKWLDDESVLLYSTYSEGKSVIMELF